MYKKPLIILTGPTAVGKTALSIQLAKAIGGEIISADSMQIYKRMDIGTAKVTSDEMQGVQHYLIDELEPEEEFNVSLFAARAKQAVNEIYRKGKMPIVAGGTGFYIQALLYDIDFTEDDNDYAYRAELQTIFHEKGSAFLHRMLEEIDPESAQAIHVNNTKRVIRALEYYHLTGEKISIHNQRESTKESTYDFVYFVLDMNREKLYQRINLRVDQMLREGLVQEVKELISEGCKAGMTSMEGIGYKQLVPYLEGKCDLESAISQIKQDTRHFAKRQMTWFRREKQVTFIHKDDYANDEEILHEMIRIIHNKISKED